MSISTLRPVSKLCISSTGSASSLSYLSDDSLLVLLLYLPMPSLLSFLSLSRRLYRLIVEHTLPRFRTLLYGYSKAEQIMELDTPNGGRAVVLYFSRRFHSYVEFCQLSGLNAEAGSPLQHLTYNSRPRKQHILMLRSFPESLPLILPRLASLTFTFYIGAGELPSQQRKTNGLLCSYLRASWSRTLVSLHLSIEITTMPHGDSSCLLRLNHLSALRHLFLNFTKQFNILTVFEFILAESVSPLLPGSMSILGQLRSFSLHNYWCKTPSTFLQQLGPNLDYLSLCFLSCPADDIALFLRGKPAYRRTLKTFEVFLVNRIDIHGDRVFTVVSENLPSLERLYGKFRIKENVSGFFGNLAKLSILREINNIDLHTDQLRRLRDTYPRPALPRLSSLRTVSLCLINPAEKLTPEELFEEILPFLADIFCALENVYIAVDKGTYSSILSDRMAIQMKTHFKRLANCTAKYYV